MRRILTALLPCLLAFAAAAAEPPAPADYFDAQGRADAWQGGVRMIPIHTPSGDFRVWTKRIGNNPRIKVLLLHGGPGGTHEYFEAFDSFLPADGIEYYYYDQLGSYYSDQPDDMTPFLSIDHYVEEVEQVRQALVAAITELAAAAGVAPGKKLANRASGRGPAGLPASKGVGA